jgi:hypothetical protein
MRRILVEQARRKGRLKRSGGLVQTKRLIELRLRPLQFDPPAVVAGRTLAVTN